MICALCGKCHNSATHCDGLCDHCARSLRPAADRMVGGVLVRPAFWHDGAMRAFVHRLKYGGTPSIPAIVVAAMVRRLPPDASSLVPVPRALLRTLRYGVDPAEVLAGAVARHTGLPLVRGLAGSVVAASQARRGRTERKDPRFRALGPLPAGAVIIDDVVTTGRTLAAAARVLGPAATVAVTLTTSARP